MLVRGARPPNLSEQPFVYCPKLHSSLKWKCRYHEEIFVAVHTYSSRHVRQCDEIFINGCTGSCHFDNFWCRQCRKLHQNGHTLLMPNFFSGKFSVHYSDVIMSAMASQITGVSIVCSTVFFSGAENFKATRHWPLCEEFTGDQWIPRTKGQLRGKCSHLMTSSCGLLTCQRTSMLPIVLINLLWPDQNGRHFSMTFSIIFPWMKNIVFWLRFSLKFCSRVRNWQKVRACSGNGLVSDR